MTKEKQKARAFIENVPVFCAFDEIVDISALKPNPRNPNSHPDSQLKLLAEVIKKTGWRASITVSTLSGYIVKGHGRLYAAQIAGFKNVPVEYQSFKNEDEELSALLADNKLAELAEIDTEKLSEIFRDFEFEDLSLTGYSQDEYSALLDDILEEESLNDDEVPELSENNFTQKGDLWLLGDHRLICGDATLDETYSLLLNGEFIDLLLTDPPYNVNYEGGTADKLKIQNDNLTNEEFRNFLNSAFSCIDKVMNPGTPFYIWHSDSERFNFHGACIDTGWLVKQCLIWNKNHISLGRQDYQWKHEPCLYGWKPGAAHYFIDDRSLATVLDFDKPLKSELHPTIKPVELFSFLIKNSTLRNNIVLDSFGGSGTTLISCQHTGRKARLIELDEKYCDVIVKRFVNNFPSEDVKCMRQGKEILWDEVMNSSQIAL